MLETTTKGSEICTYEYHTFYFLKNCVLSLMRNFVFFFFINSSYIKIWSSLMHMIENMNGNGEDV